MGTMSGAAEGRHHERTARPVDAAAVSRVVAASLDDPSCDDLDRIRVVREFVRVAQDEAGGPADVAVLLEQEPPGTGHRGWDALFGGLAEWVASSRGIDPPAWAYAEGRFADRFFFPQPTGFGKASALANAPAAFRRRGVFVDPLALESDGVSL
jgi:hypothetical protein